jgi:hypothetical protein
MERMAGNGTATFANPDDYQAGIGGASVNLIVTGGGDFKVRLTRLNLRHLHAFSCSEKLPRIAYISLQRKRAFVSFPTSDGSSFTYCGVELRFGDASADQWRKPIGPYIVAARAARHLR